MSASVTQASGITAIETPAESAQMRRTRRPKYFFRFSACEYSQSPYRFDNSGTLLRYFHDFVNTSSRSSRHKRIDTPRLIRAGIFCASLHVLFVFWGFEKERGSVLT